MKKMLLAAVILCLTGTMANNPSVSPRQVVDRIVSQINEELALYNRTN
jgi:hypothetical protein